MDTASEPVDRDITTPFLLRLYYRTGAYHRPEEFSITVDLPPHIILHTWPDATLAELTQLVAASPTTLLPNPAIGTRLAFRHLYHDLRAGAGARLAMQDLGSVVIGDGGPGIATDPDEMDDGRLKEQHASSEGAAKTLADARFVVGDIMSVAILPPSAVDGSVAGPGAARIGRGYGIGSGLGAVGTAADVRNGRDAALRGAGLGHGRAGLGAGSGINGRRWGERDGRDAAPPLGEWRRGERLPDAPPMHGRGRGRPRW